MLLCIRVVCLITPGSFEALALKSDFQRATYEMLNCWSAGKGTLTWQMVLCNIVPRHFII